MKDRGPNKTCTGKAEPADEPSALCTAWLSSQAPGKAPSSADIFLLRLFTVLTAHNETRILNYLNELKSGALIGVHMVRF